MVNRRKLKRPKSAWVARFAAAVCAGMIVLLASSCATTDRIPEGVGALTEPGRSPEGLVLEIGTGQVTGRIREPLRFTATIRNLGSQDVRVPVDPILQYIWIYPNRQKDHFLVEIPKACHYSEDSTRILRPGETMELGVDEIDTQWFPFAGVTEFQAVWILPENTNPGLDGFPRGPIHSNRYGVQMKIR